MPSFLTIQKPDYVNRLSISSFAATIKPPSFDGSNYKHWRERLILWLIVLRMIHVKEDKPEQFSLEEGSAFDETDTLFRGCVISVLAENLVDFYVRMPTGKALWDALEAQYGVSDAGSELYVMGFLTIGWLKTVLWWNRSMKYILSQKISKIVAKRLHVCYPISLWPKVLSLNCHLLGGILLLH